MMKRYTLSKQHHHTKSYLLFALIAILAACTPRGTSTAVEDPSIAEPDVDNAYLLTRSQYQSAGMKLGKLTLHPFKQIVKAIGVVEVPPEKHVAINSYFSGFVRGLKLITGEHVKKGQVLFTLVNPAYAQIQEDFLKAQEEMEYLKSDYERQKSLAEDNITSQKNYLKAKTDYMLIKIKHESLRKKLLFMHINPKALTYKSISTTIAVTAPTDGYLTHINITEGAFLNPADRAMSIINTEHLHLELKVFEKDLTKIAIGQHIQFKLQSDDSKTYSSTVHLIHKNIDLEKRTIGIHGHLVNKKNTANFIPGMYVEANICTDSKMKPALPKNAVVEANGKYYVLAKKTSSGYSFEKKEVNVGMSSDGYIEIVNAKDFRDSTQFLIEGAYNLITDE